MKVFDESGGRQASPMPQPFLPAVGCFPAALKMHRADWPVFSDHQHPDSRRLTAPAKAPRAAPATTIVPVEHRAQTVDMRIDLAVRAHRHTAGIEHASW